MISSICFDLNQYLSVLTDKEGVIHSVEYPIVKAEVIYSASEHPNTLLIANREGADYIFRSNGIEWFPSPNN
jgi:hypothetical protein